MFGKVYGKAGAIDAIWHLSTGSAANCVKFTYAAFIVLFTYYETHEFHPPFPLPVTFDAMSHIRNFL